MKQLTNERESQFTLFRITQRSLCCHLDEQLAKMSLHSSQ